MTFKVTYLLQAFQNEIFTRATLASAGVSCRRLSVRLSQVGVLLKRLKRRITKQRHTIDQEL